MVWQRICIDISQPAGGKGGEGGEVTNEIGSLPLFFCCLYHSRLGVMTLMSLMRCCHAH